MAKLSTRTPITTVPDTFELPVTDPGVITNRVTKDNFLKASEIKTKYESNANTNAFTDAEQVIVSNTSGINTGDQTITLTGDVTGSGTGSFAATIANAPLSSIKGLTTAADKMIYTTASDTYAVADLTTAGRALLDDATASDQRTTMGVAIGSDVQAFDADTAKTDVVQEYTKQQNFNATTLTDAANISWDLDDNQVASVTLDGNRTLDNPTNMKDGATYILTVIQDGTTGSRTLAYGTAYKFPSGVAPVLSTAVDSVDIITFVSDGTNMYGAAQLNFS